MTSARYFFLAFAIIITAGSARVDHQKSKTTGYHKNTFWRPRGGLREQIHVRIGEEGVHCGVWVATTQQAAGEGEGEGLHSLI